MNDRPLSEKIDQSLDGEDIDLALLPVNERNVFRDRQCIVGNMTLREAFQMATDLGVKTLVPTHWDLFAPNGVDRREIEFHYALSPRAFHLEIVECGDKLPL